MLNNDNVLLHTERNPIKKSARKREIYELKRERVKSVMSKKKRETERKAI